MAPQTILETVVFLLVAILIPQQVAGAPGDCVNVATSEGIRTLPNNAMACDALLGTETDADKGKRYIICDYGSIIKRDCQFGLRFDTNVQGCNWPTVATCNLNLPGGQAPATTTTTTTTTTTPKPTTTTTKPTATSANPADTPTPTTTTTTTTTTTSTTTTKPPTSQSTFFKSPCTTLNCQLPNCFCYGAKPSVPLSDTPQFIMLTFDDAVTNQLYTAYFKQLLVDRSYNIHNPNNCPIRAAFYLSNQDTDYNLVRQLAIAGNEFASHTVNHSLPAGTSPGDYADAVEDIDGLRNIVAQKTGIPNIKQSILGFRSPYLLVAHDIQFDALRDLGFLYDSSIVNVEIYSGRVPLWPYTLDSRVQQCPNPPCPTKAYPGLWEVPINGWIGSNGYSCSLIDGCSVGSNLFTASESEWIAFYQQNFDEFYKNRVPLHMFTHGAMFLRSTNSYPAMITWFENITQNYNNVWLVTPLQVIEWMKNPLTNQQMIDENWGC